MTNFVVQAAQKSGLELSSLGIFTKSHSTLIKSSVERIHSYIVQDKICTIIPSHRICNCLKKRIDKDKLRSIMYNEIREKAHWSNVQRCGSLWVCPVCASQISEGRRVELEKCVNWWKSQNKNNDVLLMTLTVPHKINHNLETVLDNQKLALKRFFGGRYAVDLFRRLGRHHQIKSLEITFGANGWHPHYHILVFVDRKSPANIATELLEHWQNVCVKSGFDKPNENGLDLRCGDKAAAYVAKWGKEQSWTISHEMTKSILKNAKLSSVTPFQLPAIALQNDKIFGRCPEQLFKNYADAIKGQRQLVYSRGLKAAASVEELTDEDLAHVTDECAIELQKIDSFLFSILKKYQARHLYLQAIEKDYNSGCLGDGDAERLLERLLEQEILSIDEKQFVLARHKVSI